jgi:hypothetical protein
MSAVAYAFRVSRAAAGAPKRLVVGLATVASAERVPRISRLLALAHRFQGMIDCGAVASMADLARLGRVSRARITQIMDLLLLAPDIQEELLYLPSAKSGRDAITLKQMRAVCAAVAWGEQRARWASFDLATCTPPTLI